MSSSRTLRALTIAAASVLALGGCFTPLYAPNASGVSVVADQLAAVELAPLREAPGQERTAHYLTQELKYLLDRGSPTPTPKRYRLSLTISQSVQSAIVDTSTGRATAATLIGTVNYNLVEIAEPPKPVTSGTAISEASYDRYPQRFATVRAARDAETRIAKELAEQIKTRLAASFAGRG